MAPASVPAPMPLTMGYRLESRMNPFLPRLLLVMVLITAVQK